MGELVDRKAYFLRRREWNMRRRTRKGMADEWMSAQVIILPVIFWNEKDVVEQQRHINRQRRKRNRTLKRGM